MMQAPDPRPEGAEIPKLGHSSARASDWLWRPWYARLWWGTAASFWLILGFDSFVVKFLPDLWGRDWFSLLFVTLHPFFIVPVLGFGFARTWIRSLPAEAIVDFEDEWRIDRKFGYRSRFRTVDPTNPLDPRYISNPLNPMSEAWRDRHVRGHR